MTPGPARALPAALAALLLLVTGLLTGCDTAGEAGGGTAAAPGAGAAQPTAPGRWTTTWAAAPASAEPGSRGTFTDTSVRNAVHTSVGGSRVRIHLSNLFGDTPLTISHTTVALAAGPGSPATRPGTTRTLTFDGEQAVTVPPGEQAVSDGTALRVPAAANLLVTTHTAEAPGPATHHPHARQTNWTGPGNLTRNVTGTAFARQSPSWHWLTAVDVHTTRADGTVAVLGDSLTDGLTATPDTHHRWTDVLARRLLTEPGAPRLGVANAGISGNRILTDGADHHPPNGPSALHRLRRDALSRAGVGVLVVQLGLNDILKEPPQRDPDRILAGLRALTRRAHTHGVHVVGTTLTPCGGHRGHRPGQETVRQAVNARIRAGSVFDAVADFDAALRDPSHPARLRPDLDSGDHLHPNDDGYRAMAHALPLSTLRTGSPPAPHRDAAARAAP
ncbi:SGNH/GDSL hydrolase family protein [Streptomyces sp. TR06-5]|uniref:SGNH/GDSL hydrolase family protein n=1 Tax=unclassified Streptomyces TaxID=2593676 RepID=UPI0039A0C52D